MLSGCGSAPRKIATPHPKKKEDTPFGEGLTALTTNGDAVIRSLNGDAKRLYSIKWAKAQIDASDKGIFAGSMDEVKGSVFQKDVDASSFSATRAEAKREEQLLVLTGGVTLTSTSKKIHLTCDRVEWHGHEELIKALGNVRAAGAFGTMSKMDELWATPDLAIISTPALFAEAKLAASKKVARK